MARFGYRVDIKISALRGETLAHTLSVLAIVLFVLWMLFHAASTTVNLIWLAIIAMVILWLVGFFRRGPTY